MDCLSAPPMPNPGRRLQVAVLPVAVAQVPAALGVQVAVGGVCAAARGGLAQQLVVAGVAGQRVLPVGARQLPGVAPAQLGGVPPRLRLRRAAERAERLLAALLLLLEHAQRSRWVHAAAVLVALLAGHLPGRLAAALQLAAAPDQALTVRGCQLRRYARLSILAGILMFHAPLGDRLLEPSSQVRARPQAASVGAVRERAHVHGAPEAVLAACLAHGGRRRVRDAAAALRVGAQRRQQAGVHAWAEQAPECRLSKQGCLCPCDAFPLVP